MGKFARNLFDLDCFFIAVREKRNLYGWSIRDLAEVAVVSPTTIQHAEQGADIKLSTAVTIANALDIKITVDKLG